MSEIIIHHYPVSPGAEKLRAGLGLKKLAWRSVEHNRLPDRPELFAMTGGYRRIPVLQVGNDVVCDTALICDVLEHLQPTPTLYPSVQGQTSKGAERIMAQWADTTLFAAAMAYNFSPKGAEHFFAGQPPEAVKVFAEDRKAMRGGAARMHPGDATAAYKSYLRRIASMVDDQPFVLGAQPTVADFACYHPLWFTRRIEPIAHIFEPTPSVVAWMDRIAALGHGTAVKSSATESIASCADNTPAKGLFDLENDVFQDEHGIPLGSRVSITAESFGLEATEGELVAATRTRYTLRRTDERAGTVHVHFPRVGFAMKAVA